MSVNKDFRKRLIEQQKIERKRSLSKSKLSKIKQFKNMKLSSIEKKQFNSSSKKKNLNINPLVIINIEIPIFSGN